MYGNVPQDIKDRLYRKARESLAAACQRPNFSPASGVGVKLSEDGRQYAGHYEIHPDGQELFTCRIDSPVCRL